MTRERLAPRAPRAPDAAIDGCLSIDRGRLIGLARRLQRARDPQRASLQKQFDELLAASCEAVAARQATLPQPHFDDGLPVNQRRDEIAALIATHQVVIVCGETGSGKTTQLPKICLTLGRGGRGLIGHTQPRRIAARATASRIAAELGQPLGRTVGYKVRFSDRTAPESAIKLMTDGILLAETQGDRWLSAYDTIIIDEAHERSLNIDFLLGFLKTLLPRRPDLKVIVTSATLDAERFATHFSADGKPAPVIEVSGRLYPIELRYRPVGDGVRSAGDDGDDADAGVRERGGRRGSGRQARERDLLEGIVDAVLEAQSLGPGDVLVFLPGEREIREAGEALRKAALKPGTELLPLFARQSASEQARVFSPGNGRRVVLATNVAETSLTVPGVRYVVDSGLARVKRYSVRGKVEQLQVEKIAQASARQRAGRCGRVSDGVCFRLYDEDDFNARPSHPDPELLRSSLAGVILRMRALGLGEVEAFPFLDAPSPRLINDGYQLLLELGAIDETPARALTETGQALARLPLDPRLGRMLLAARELAVLPEVLVVASALSAQDVRDRPAEHAAAADQAHAQFRGNEREQSSEFIWYLHAWRAWQAVRRHQSSSKQKAWCRSHWLNALRLREWEDVYHQLHVLCAELGWQPDAPQREPDAPVPYEALHKALLSGLLGNIGVRVDDAGRGQEGSYLGARGVRFWPHPGSARSRNAGKWVMVAELVDTSRLFGRCVARIEPAWVEAVAGHLIHEQIFEPHWSKSHGAVRAWARGTLHGVVLYPRRAVSYRDIDPALCRDLLIRDGLVAGEIAEGPARQMPFLQHNRKLVADIEHLEHKSRRPDVLVDETLIAAFYDARLPAEVLDLADLTRWRRQAEARDPKCLFLTREQLMRHEAHGVTTDRFPPTMAVLGQSLALRYHHAPGEDDDGVTLVVPVAMLNQVPAHRCEWLVPGLLEEKVAALMRTVPQKHRHRLQPIARSAADFCAEDEAGGFDHDQPLMQVLQAFVETRVSLKLAMDAFRPENLNPHCFMRFEVLDGWGKVLGASRDLAQLRRQFRDVVAQRFDAAALGGAEMAGGADGVERRRRGRGKGGAAGGGAAHAPGNASVNVAGTQPPEPAAPTPALAREWCFGSLPELLDVMVDGQELIGYPALVDEGDGVRLRPVDTPEDARRLHREGVRRLLQIALKDPIRAITRLPDLRALALQYLPFGTEAQLHERLIAAALNRVCLADPLPMDEAAFVARRDAGRARLSLVAQEFLRLTATIVQTHAALRKRLSGLRTAFPEVAQDVETQLAELLPDDFLVTHEWAHLQHCPRYLQAIEVRLDKLRGNVERDAAQMRAWREVALPFQRIWRDARRQDAVDDALVSFRWLLEELRVSLFAQPLKTPVPVSVKRLQKIWLGRSRG